MRRGMYTGREELRACKRRNQREYVYEDCDWRRAVEEDEMRADNSGALVHPAHWTRAKREARGGRSPNRAGAAGGRRG